MDVPSVISTSTALLAGLLAGEDNFGKVLGTYGALAIDSFSGGGGAVNFVMRHGLMTTWNGDE